MEEQEQEQKQEQEEEEKIEEDDESIHIGSHVCVVEDDYVVSATQYQIEDQKAEIHFVVDEHEIEELNRRCAEFIRTMKKRIKSESFSSLEISKTV